jgi:hypothetical protein
MKKIVLLTLGVVLFFSSCRRKTGPDCCPPVEPIGSIEVHLNHLWGTDTIVRGTGKYLTAQGDTVTISDIRGLLSNFVLKFTDGSDFPLEYYHYYKLSTASTNTFLLKGIPDEVYQKMSFFLGLDSTSNHSDVTTYPRTSALSTYQAGGEMHWNWADGFIFTNVTGTYRPANASRFRGFSYHIGMDPNLVKISLPTNGLTISGNSRLMELNVDWKEMFESPNSIKIANQDVTHSTSGDTLAAQLSANMVDMVKIGSIK